MPRHSAATRLTRWLQEPGPRHLKVLVTGPVGSGKSACIREAEAAVRETSRGGTVRVDCRGMSADEVAVQLVDAWGGDARFLRKRNDPLADAFAQWTQGQERAVVLLANAQWAGTTVTSAEPQRLLTHVVIPLLRSAECPVAVLFEVDQEQGRITLPPSLDVESGTVLEAADRSGPPPSELMALHPQLRALAAAEIRDVPLPAWSALCAAFGLDGAPEGLRHVATALPELLNTWTDEAGIGRVAFRTDGARHLVRTNSPLSHDDHARLADALLNQSLHRDGAAGPWRAADSVARYAARTLPLHCAAAGILSNLTLDPRFLANVDRHALLTGLALLHRDGVPSGTPAGDAHYLEAAGVEPATHEEWISWLHWASMNRGAPEFAAALARAAGELPWLTLWSGWRPYGLFGPSPRHDAAEADELVLGVADGIDVVATQLEIDEDDLDEEVDPEADRYAVERMWRRADGTPLGDPVQVQLHEDDTSDIDQADGRAFEPVEEPDDAGQPPAPRAPSASTSLVKAPDGTQVHGGTGGIYALQVLDPARVASRPQWRSRPLLAAHNTAATWQLPAALRADAPPSRSWYESAFGRGTCHPVSPDALPDGITHTDTVRFLGEVGLPDLDDAFPFLSFAPPGALTQVAPPPFLPESAAGPYFTVGRWVRGDLLLDGATGRLYLTDIGDGDADHLLSSGLRQTCTLLALTAQRRQSGFTVPAETFDARRSLATWARDIDPVAAPHPHWTALLSGHWDDAEAV
ncbi:SUKH-4 family immunity protein [Streptomyces sp. NPDC093589]|uniref:SUKH-4 family immunity protein n=1 Tax=Streptomyces sp. NPDC093589 TaxID=3366043 RepID=UPI00382871E7